MTDAPTSTLLTADELLVMADDGQRYELVEGRLIVVPPASYKSSVVAMNIGAALAIFVRQHRVGFCAMADGGVRLRADPDTVRAPDVSFVRTERVPPGGMAPGYLDGAPDLVVEVLSPSDRYNDVQRKVQEYLDAGARLVWVLDPEARNATVYRPGRRPLFLDENGVLDGEDVVSGFTLKLADVWV